MVKQEYTITVYTENQTVCWNRIAIIFRAAKINIESLNTSPSESGQRSPVHDRDQRNGRSGPQTLPAD